jgi:hypothetical protein
MIGAKLPSTGAAQGTAPKAEVRGSNPFGRAISRLPCRGSVVLVTDWSFG